MAERKRQNRSRKDNFVHDEIVALIQAYARSTKILQRRCKSTLSNCAKKLAWDAVTADVNVVSRSHRSAHELKRKWQKLASEARADLARRQHPDTGGEWQCTEDAYTSMIADMFEKESALVDGVVVEGRIDIADDSLFKSEAEG